MNTVDAIPKSRRIRELNDRFRTTFTGGKVMMTSGVAALAPVIGQKVIDAVKGFADFDEGNDPHKEHDFGCVEVEGDNYFFKVDYYSSDMSQGSEDPADPEQTTRVLTIMRADEY